MRKLIMIGILLAFFIMPSIVLSADKPVAPDTQEVMRLKIDNLSMRIQLEQLQLKQLVDDYNKMIKNVPATTEKKKAVKDER